MAISSLFPSTLSEHPFLTVFALVTIPVLSILIHDFLLWLRLPPGPTPLPFIGNKHQIQSTNPWRQFQEWSYTYGPIYTLWIGRQPTIILSDPTVAVDLLEKRSNKYSSRPRMIALGELYSDNNSILVQPYGKPWSIRRKLLHSALTPKALGLYKPTQEAEASRLCHRLLSTPHAFEKLLEAFTSSIVFCVAYGHRIDSLNAKVIRDRFTFMHFQAQLLVLGSHMVETFPVLKHIPAALAPWKREIQKAGAAEGASNKAIWDDVKAEVATARQKGNEDAVPDSLAKMLITLNEREPVPLSDLSLSYLPASLFGAGSDTTASTLCSAFLALVTHPAALTRAQRELDAVVPLAMNRTPDFSDENKLPYLRALVKEVLRWRPVAVLGGTPRSTTEGDTYNGYYLPKGTSVLTNAWAINHNEAYYPNSQRFEPARFLPLVLQGSPDAAATLTSEDEKTIQQLQPEKIFPGKSGENVFGVGRRICPGAGLAENSLFAALSKLLWAFEIAPLEGENYDIYDYTQGINVRPRSFKCRITVRSEEHRVVLEKEQKNAMVWLERFTPFAE